MLDHVSIGVSNTGRTVGDEAVHLLVERAFREPVRAHAHELGERRLGNQHCPRHSQGAEHRRARLLVQADDDGALQAALGLQAAGWEVHEVLDIA